jgi:hypothetical protein
MFCVGVSVRFGAVIHLDRLMIAVKEIVGEQYHVAARRGSTLELAPSTLQYRPPRDVWSKKYSSKKVGTHLDGKTEVAPVVSELGILILSHFDQFGRPCYTLHACRNFEFGTWRKWPLHTFFFSRFLRFLLRFLKPFLRLLFMVSALGQNDRYNRYISAFLERLLRVTAELIEMAQYFFWSMSCAMAPYISHLLSSVGRGRHLYVINIFPVWQKVQKIERKKW